MKTAILSLTILTAIASAAENPYAHYPPVAKTATINGFGDRVYDAFPQCAKDCVRKSTSNTPCPYWDIGCLCMMPQFQSEVALCIADNCSGSNVESASQVAVNSCSAAGVNSPYWFINGAASTALSFAAQKPVAFLMIDATLSSPTFAAASTALSSAAQKQVASSMTNSYFFPTDPAAPGNAIVAPGAASGSTTAFSSSSEGAQSSSTAKTSGTSSSASAVTSRSSFSSHNEVMHLSISINGTQSTSAMVSLSTLSANGVAQLVPAAWAGVVAVVAAF